MRFLIVLAFVFLTHCELLFQGRYNPPTTKPPGSNPIPPPINPNSPFNKPLTTPTAKEGPWGVIKCNASQLNQFQQSIQGFLSTKIDPNLLGVFSCTSQGKGGVFIRGSVVLPDEKSFDLKSQDQSMYIRQSDTSHLEIHFEPMTGQTPSPISLKLSYGQVNGQVVTLSFEDHAGEISLDGHVNNRIYKGVFKFTNFYTWDGKSPGHSGLLGEFAIPICQLMKCKQ